MSLPKIQKHVRLNANSSWEWSNKTYIPNSAVGWMACNLLYGRKVKNNRGLKTPNGWWGNPWNLPGWWRPSKKTHGDRRHDAIRMWWNNFSSSKSENSKFGLRFLLTKIIKPYVLNDLHPRTKSGEESPFPTDPICHLCAGVMFGSPRSCWPACTTINHVNLPARSSKDWFWSNWLATENTTDGTPKWWLL